MAGHQAGVEVDHQAGHGDTGAGQGWDRPARLSPEQPGPFPRVRPGLFQRVQPGRADAVQHPPRRRGRRHATEQTRLIPQRRQIGDGLTAVGQQHRKIGQHPTRRMRGPALTSVTGRDIERLR
jgi:hypothetical protein